MLENFLPDQLAFAVAIGSEPDPLGGAQRLANRFQLGRLVAAVCGAGSIEPFGAQQDWRPTLPFRNRILGLLKVKQMTLGGKHFTIARSNRSAHVLRLAGLFGNDDLIGHFGSGQRSAADLTD